MPGKCLDELLGTRHHLLGTRSLALVWVRLGQHLALHSTVQAGRIPDEGQTTIGFHPTKSK